jgi:hypothetical protein
MFQLTLHSVPRQSGQLFMPVGLCVRAANVRDEVGPDFCALSEARLPAMLRYRVPYGVLNTISLVNLTV